MSNFGWGYPAGAEFDPNAPWNEKDETVCSKCGVEVDEGDDSDPCDACQGAYDRYIDSKIDEARERRAFGDD